MGVFALGNQRVGIVTDVIDLDGGQPIVNEYGQPQTHEAVVWVDGCVFESQSSATTTVSSFEQQALTVTTSDPAFAFLPVVDGQVPAVDDDDQPAPMPWSQITSDLKLRHNDLTYAMRGDAVLEQDIHGREDHVFCACEREKG
ncbi:hypothetical protein PJN38_24225 [Mycobacterium kansasii]